MMIGDVLLIGTTTRSRFIGLTLTRLLLSVSIAEMRFTLLVLDDFAFAFDICISLLGVCLDLLPDVMKQREGTTLSNLWPVHVRYLSS